MRRWFSKIKPILQLPTGNFSKSTNDVIFNEINKCGIITLNRPKALNSLNKNMVKLIYPTLLKWKTDPKISHVILEGSGEKALCAGGDLREIIDAGKINVKEACTFFESEYRLNHLIGTFGKPYVSLMNGITMGGGIGLSVHGMYRVATEKTVFAMPETAIGLYPDVGGSYFLPRLQKHLGMYLALVGHRLKGRDVLYVGVATHYVNSNQISNLKDDLIKASTSLKVDDVLKQYNDTKEDHNFSLLPFIDSINKHFSQSSVENILESLSKHISITKSMPEKTWCQQHIDIIRKMSPTSLKITFRQLKEGQNLSFKNCFIMEYRLSSGCMRNHDFYEGVRAVIFDKDNKPKWKPPVLEEVTEEMIDQYFKPLENDLKI